ncbi:MAG: AbrB family transcriptional regulator [Arenicella sp.]
MAYRLKNTAFLIRIVSMLFVLCLGLLGGIVLFLFNVPIPFLLGSVLIIIMAYKLGIHINKPNAVFSRWMRVVIGVALGESVGGNISLFSTSTASVVMLAIFFTVVVTAFGMRFFRRIQGFTASDLYISSLPGGLSFLISLAGDLGGKFPKIALIHATRVVTLVFVLSAMSYFIGVDKSVTEDINPFAFTLHVDLLPILFTVLLSGVIAEIFKVPGGQVIFGLLLSSLAYHFGFIQIAMPEIIMTVAMAFLGILLGTALVQKPSHEYPKIMSLSLTFTCIALMIGMLFAFGMTHDINEHFLLYFLALSPGGIAEISLITLALGLDAGLVVVVHASRYFFIVFIGVIGMNFLNKKNRD